MNKFRFTIKVLTIAIFTFAFASMTQAQATRTWVSGVGDDANPCSRTAPCKTFAGAISKTATDGEIDALDSGGFGAVTITKSITIDGDSNLAGILASLTTGVIVNVSAASGSNFVQLRNLSINGAGNGLNGIRIINGVSGLAVSIENCVIFGFKGAGTDRGISDERTQPGTLFVSNTLIKNNGGAGIAMVGTGSVKASLNTVQLYKNNDGVVITGAATLSARDTISHNAAGAGFTASAGAAMELNNCQSYNNGTGVEAAGGGTVVVLSRTRVIKNTANGLGFAGGVIQSYGNNEVAGNAGSNGPFSAGGTPLQ